MDSPRKPKTGVIIVAAGRGERAGTENGPKQYRDIAEKSVLAHSLEPFLNHIKVHNAIVVIHEDDAQLYKDGLQDHPKLLPPANGGATRQLSVLAGLMALEDKGCDLVLIHDAARPFVDGTLISRVIDGLENADAALPAIAVADTLKLGKQDGTVEATIPRDGLFSAQTPQGFHFQKILTAHQKAKQNGLTEFTDDSALAEWAHIPVQLVDGSAQNTKITTRADLEDTRHKMTTPIPDIRVGHGYDTHQLVEGSSVWLCGVNIPHTHALNGHSDADVGLHALTDALLATIADGDIGSHFPPTDAQWKDARSDQFLKHAINLVTRAKGTITHMDVTLLCEAPKIGPNRDAMRYALSAITGVDLARISVKATTNERIGFIGREEGIVALATATVVMGTL